MRDPVECQACHKPIRSKASMGRRIGGRCWRKLRPDQRAVMRALLGRTVRPSAAAVRRALNQPPPSTDGQLPLEEQENTP
ncbi:MULTISPECIES: hypothetical protein [Streptomyces]|uniref:Uncharacterized protein n=2 Tax=Streptomyces TaxID=1883 RepID=A0A8I0P3J0_9ACTN|nr:MULTISPECIES: hypothetical protein [Streptomyces]KND29884.1 hypothetical protein IQ64_41785 [Streptomyces stelliscabiei]MBE1598991.1 hypothetical protein [Streptomyces stelliscabiei]MBE1599734.1 hypothetical protein [Streptomyces stelliscabiei]MBP5922146.1 hypothetical protein [Streptomyces sp. LBUM 1483]MDX2519392.1 hypothetical protein [Streptomyces stelliscabiei]